MDDLVTWLRAQLDEDERVARTTRFQSWRAERSEHSVYASESFVVRPEDQGAHDYEYIVPPDSEGSEGIEPPMAEHIARWDPARVLAEVEAKRRILDEWDKRWHAEDPNYDIRRTDDNWGDALTFAVKLLAQPYAGQPGWQEQWRVSD